jgi:hypothetical protein
MPHVVAPAKLLFCEGRPGSLDDLLLGHILPVGRVLVKPLGGKQGMRAYVEGYLAGHPDTSRPSYLCFRDRDFDVEPPDEPQLIRLPGKKPVWLSHRTTVENYVIDADLLRQYWVERENAPRWRHGPAPSIDEIEGHIQESAHELAEYQAVRWALARLEPGDRWPGIGTTWVEGSGVIPASLDYATCVARACQLVAGFQNRVSGIDPQTLERHAEGYRQRFSERRFHEERKYLVWFHGKDHLARLCRRLRANFPRWHYACWAAEHVDVGKHPDLRELAARAGRTG